MLRSVLFTALVAFSASAGAQGFDYDYFSVGYSRIDFDDDFGGSADGDTFGAAGSYGLTENFFVLGSFDTGDVEDDFGDSVDVMLYDLGFGYHMPLTDNVDVFGTLSYEYVELSDGGLSFDENGYGVGVGLRARTGNALEFNAGLELIDLDDFVGDGTFLNLGVLYSVTDNLQIGLDGSLSDDLSTYTLSGRYYFGSD